MKNNKKTSETSITYNGETWTASVRLGLHLAPLENLPTIVIQHERGEPSYALRATGTKDRHFRTPVITNCVFSDIKDNIIIAHQTDYAAVPLEIRRAAVELFHTSAKEHKFSIQHGINNADLLAIKDTPYKQPHTPDNKPTPPVESLNIESLTEVSRGLGKNNVFKVVQGQNIENITRENLPIMHLQDQNGYRYVFCASELNLDDNHFTNVDLFILDGQKDSFVSLSRSNPEIINQLKPEIANQLKQNYQELLKEHNQPPLSPELMTLTLDGQVTVEVAKLDTTLEKLLSDAPHNPSDAAQAGQAREDAMNHYRLTDRALDEALAEGGNLDSTTIKRRIEELETQADKARSLRTQNPAASKRQQLAVERAQNPPSGQER